VVKEPVCKDNVMETTNTSQDLVNMLLAVECKEWPKTAEDVNQLSVDLMKLKTMLVLDVLVAALTANASLKLMENAKTDNAH